MMLANMKSLHLISDVNETYTVVRYPLRAWFIYCDHDKVFIYDTSENYCTFNSSFKAKLN